MVTLLKASPPLLSRISHGLLQSLKTQKRRNNQSYTNSLNQPLSSIRCQWPRVHGTKKKYHIKFTNRKFPHSRTNILQVIIYRDIILLPLYLRTTNNCLGINHFNVPLSSGRLGKNVEDLNQPFLVWVMRTPKGSMDRFQGAREDGWGEKKYNL